MLTVPFGHTVDALCQLLGRFVEVSATVARQQRRARVAETGESVPMHAPDQVAVTGVLESGAVAAIHYHGALSRGNNFLWEINGTEGDLVVVGESGHLQYGRVMISGAQRKDRQLAPLPVPDSYRRVDIAPREFAYAVAHAYKCVAEDLRAGTHRAPTFADALSLHRFLDAVDRAATTGQRQTSW
jgi:predicted dehydrogenase